MAKMNVWKRMFPARTHEGAVACSEQELRFDEGHEQGLTRDRIKAPQPPRLRLGQTQAWHF